MSDIERESLLEFLQRQRDLVQWKLQDAPDDALRAIGTPTGLTAHGIVLHLTSCERGWFRWAFADQVPPMFDDTEDPDADFKPAPDLTLAQLLADYAAETKRSDEVILAAESLDDQAVHRARSLRWILLHMIEETARHLGHLDLMREQADGSTGERPEH
ncbi:DinB family protein [Kutzneria sp. 744]|uniref:DinB family protein n=1 Tax=Kutzneria sp. (strain 744) TaxID=345341 RepID=UPI0003EEA979|nr:DinB family protein [Kutzneria sp. 744]EWM09899.1 mini-circle protein [Kutzneria sp. 744]